MRRDQPLARPRHGADLTPPARAGKGWDQRKLDTLAALRSVALTLALEHGVEQITVADIAEAAGVSRRTFFNYFHSKEDALVGENPELAAFLRRAIAARPAAEAPLAAVQGALHETITAFVTDDVRHRLRARHRLLADYPALLPHHLARYAAFERLLTDALTSRMLAGAGADPGLLATAAAGAVRLCVHRWARHGDPPLSQRLEVALAALHHGLP